jgi:polysaccharide export outer membrane protein
LTFFDNNRRKMKNTYFTFKFNKVTANLFVMGLISVLLTSCIGNKNFLYLQNKQTKTVSKNETFKSNFEEYKLKQGDILYIRMVTEDEKMNMLFNPLIGTNMNMQMMSQGGFGTPFYLMGYSIDQEGNLALPYIGKVNLLGKTVDEAKNILYTEGSKFFKNFYLQVKLAEFRFSILGAVNRPGQFFFMVNHLNILEALAMAGDVYDIAKKTNLTLIREENGETKIIPIDLTDVNLIKSKYYFIQPNDIIYVQPVKSRSLGNFSSFQTSINAALPLLSTFLMVLNTYIILNNLK